MNSALMFSKASDEWATPQGFFDALDVEFGFTIDVAASLDNAKCVGWLGSGSPSPDALAVEWATATPAWGNPPTCWMNPPYSKCREFIAKAAAEAQKGCTVVALVPSRTDTKWWHTHVWDDSTHAARPGVELRFVRGRLKFGNTGKAENSAPFPSVVIIFRPEPR